MVHSAIECKDRRVVPSAERGGVGIRQPRGWSAPVLRQRHHRLGGLVRVERRRCDPSCRDKIGKWIRASRLEWQRLGVGAGLPERQLCGCAGRRPCVGERGLRGARAAGRFVDQLTAVHALGQPPRVPSGEPQQQRRFASCQDTPMKSELRSCPFTPLPLAREGKAGGCGGAAPAASFQADRILR